MLDGDGNGRMADEVDGPVAAGRRGGSHRLPIESERSDLDGAIPDTVTIWGIPVPVLPSGRHRWPSALREMAAAKVLAGAQVQEIAKELGTCNSVVADWAKRARAAAPAAAFIEVLAPGTAKAPAKPPTDSVSTGECRIRLGDAEITIPAGYPASHLTEILHAVRSAQ